MSGFSENVKIDEGVNEQGVKTIFHYEGNDLTIEKKIDMEPLMKDAEIARQSTDGLRWGEGRIVGTIDMMNYPRIAAIKDRKERDKAILQYFKDHPAMVKFNPYYKTLAGS